MSVELFPCAGILLDACIVINLFASNHMDAILESIPRPVAIAAFVHEKEVLNIYTGPDRDVTAAKEAINLQPLIDRGMLQIVSHESQQEATEALKLSVAAIDTGEAMSAAIAAHRSWSLATDDKMAISFFMRNVPDLHLLSTPELIKHWIDTARPGLAVIADALANIRKRARYAPHRDHALYQWWKTHEADCP